MERRYCIRYRIAPGQMCSEAIRATSPAQAIEKVLAMHGPDSKPIYVPGRRARRRNPDAVSQLMNNLWNQWREP